MRAGCAGRERRERRGQVGAAGLRGNGNGNGNGGGRPCPLKGGGVRRAGGVPYRRVWRGGQRCSPKGALPWGSAVSHRAARARRCWLWPGWRSAVSPGAGLGSALCSVQDQQCSGSVLCPVAVLWGAEVAPVATPGGCGVPCSRAKHSSCVILHLSSRWPQSRATAHGKPSVAAGLCLGQGSGAGLQLEKHGINLPCGCAAYLRCQMFVWLF